jgi:hypothetical protein
MHNVEVSNRFTAKRQLREYESIEITQIDCLSECICVSGVNSSQSSRPLRLCQKRVVDVDAMLRDPIDI